MALISHPWRDRQTAREPNNSRSTPRVITQVAVDRAAAQVGRMGCDRAVMHRQRECIVARLPAHGTIRLRRGIPTLRQPRFVRRFRSFLSEACVRHGFRVVHDSIQRDHVHLLIEAQSNHSIACGMKSVGARIGKLANRLFQRGGKVLDGRYHLRALRTPLEVHRALRYVLLNHRHHAAQRRRPKHLIDCL
jgi:REP element-mobilizing transposase RayT